MLSFSRKRSQGFFFLSFFFPRCPQGPTQWVPAKRGGALHENRVSNAQRHLSAGTVVGAACSQSP
jgi:hypothetical protein